MPSLDLFADRSSTSSDEGPIGGFDAPLAVLSDEDFDALMIANYGEWNLDLDRFRRRLGQDILDRILAFMWCPRSLRQMRERVHGVSDA